jgi:hypothetical protein
LVGFRAGEARVLRDLSRVPEIQTLVDEATTQQELVHALEQERLRLDEIVGLEARRQTIGARRDLLLDDASRIVEQLRALDSEAASLRIDVQSSAALPAIQDLQLRLNARQRGDLVLRFGNRAVIVPRSAIRGIPFSGRMLVGILDFYLAQLDQFPSPHGGDDETLADPGRDADQNRPPNH